MNKVPNSAECNDQLGKVAVFVKPSLEPSVKGFPICTANVEFGREGYDAFFGWVQLVKSTDNSSEGMQFEMDPFFLFRDYSSPYCFFGFKPTLFDAPSRQTKKPISWRAHSFLAFSPPDPELFTDLKNRRVAYLVGFCWGFVIDSQGNTVLMPLSTLGAIDWNSHLAFLRKSFPTWQFEEARGPI